MGIEEILQLVQMIVNLEARIEELLKNENDKRKRKKLKKAAKNRDSDTLRKLLFDS